VPSSLCGRFFLYLENLVGLCVDVP
jgi:hypothetical protein